MSITLTTLTYSRKRIEALMSSAAVLPEGDDWRVAAFVVDGMLDNAEKNGVGSGWDVKLALEIYATDDFYEESEIDPEDVDFDIVKPAIGAAIEKIAAWNELIDFSDEYVAEVFAGDVPGDDEMEIALTDLGKARFGVSVGVGLDLGTLTVYWTDSFGRRQEHQFAPGSPSDLELGRREIERHPVEHVLGELAAHVESRGTDFIEVAMNGVADFFLLELPGGADETAIIAAIEAENLEIGGSDATKAFDPTNDIRVYRHGGLIIDQAADPRAIAERRAA